MSFSKLANSFASSASSASSAAYDPSNEECQSVYTGPGSPPITIFPASASTVSGVKRDSPPRTPTREGEYKWDHGVEFSPIGKWTPSPKRSPKNVNVTSAPSSPARSSSIGRVLEFSEFSEYCQPSPKSPPSSHTEETGSKKLLAPRKPQCESSNSASSNSAASRAEAVGDAIVAEEVPLRGIAYPPNPKRFRAFRDGMHPNASQHPTGALLPALSLAGLCMTHLPERTLSGCVGNCRRVCSGKCHL